MSRLFTEQYVLPWADSASLIFSIALQLNHIWNKELRNKCMTRKPIPMYVKSQMIRHVREGNRERGVWYKYYKYYFVTAYHQEKQGILQQIKLYPSNKPKNIQGAGFNLSFWSNVFKIYPFTTSCWVNNASWLASWLWTCKWRMEYFIALI